MESVSLAGFLPGCPPVETMWSWKVITVVTLVLAAVWFASAAAFALRFDVVSKSRIRFMKVGRRLRAIAQRSPSEFAGESPGTGMARSVSQLRGTSGGWRQRAGRKEQNETPVLVKRPPLTINGSSKSSRVRPLRVSGFGAFCVNP